MRLEKLALTVPSSPPLCLDHPLFLSVTHLDLYHGINAADRWDNWSYLASLLALTHLSLSPRISAAILPRIVAECPKILVIVTNFVARWHLDEYADALTLSDSRLVLTVVSDYVADWEAEARAVSIFGREQRSL